VSAARTSAPRKLARLVVSLWALCALALPASAHDGPPFLLIDEADFAGRTLTVYADPDVGTGTFYLYFAEGDDLAGLDLALAAAPADGRLDEATVAVERSQGTPYSMFAEFEFDRRGPWVLRIFSRGAGEPAELVHPIDVTPPGSLGPIDVVWYLSPFATIAFFWIFGMRRRRRMFEQQASLESSS